MAGEVRADEFRPPYRGRLELMPRVCPSTDRFGEVCIRFDSHTGGMSLCPFLYGLTAVADEKHYMEARSVKEMRDVVASSELWSTRAYTVLCLQAPAAHTVPGIHP